MKKRRAERCCGGVLLYGSSGAGQQLTWIDRAGKSLGTVGPTGVYTTFALSPDGRRVAVSKFQDVGSDLWTVDLDRTPNAVSSIDP